MLPALFSLPVLLIFGTMADANARLEVVGSIIGSAITIGGAYFLFHKQADDTDARHLKTMRDLIGELRTAGEFMTTEEAAGNPEPAVIGAVVGYEAALSVAAQLQSNGPSIARVVKMLEMAPARGDLMRLRLKGMGVPGPELAAQGAAVVKVADEVSGQLRRGL